MTYYYSKSVLLYITCQCSLIPYYFFYCEFSWFKFHTKLSMDKMTRIMLNFNLSSVQQNFWMFYLILSERNFQITVDVSNKLLKFFSKTLLILILHLILILQNSLS